MRSILFIFAAFIIAGCSRSLTEGEIAFLGTVHGQNVDYSKVKIAKGSKLASNKGTGAVTINNTITYRHDLYSENFAPKDTQYIDELALLAHEMTHVWQKQNKELTGYTYAKVIAEHAKYGERVYEYPPLKSDSEFLSFRYEQQGQIVGDWIMARALDPKKAKIYEKVIGRAIPLNRFLSEAYRNYEALRSDS
ncbi:DUF4157 domain-containing protein [Pseudovibrio denitrificans]|uniref:eCIS core domain-containing protein n=1 Tax=Pseudovibrio denitrificans TaxID=258256 RepID=UPI0039BF2907